jgi:hypothetical protein
VDTCAIAREQQQTHHMHSLQCSLNSEAKQAAASSPEASEELSGGLSAFRFLFLCFLTIALLAFASLAVELLSATFFFFNQAGWRDSLNEGTLLQLGALHSLACGCAMHAHMQANHATCACMSSQSTEQTEGAGSGCHNFAAHPL